MGLDVGETRIGVALSDPLGMFAQPLCSIDRKGKSTFRELADLAKKHEVTTIVLGMPFELDGNEGPRGVDTRTFYEKLQSSFCGVPGLQNVAFALWDERMTTVQAERVLIGSGLKDRERRDALDRISAAIILDSFLQSNPKS